MVTAAATGALDSGDSFWALGLMVFLAISTLPGPALPSDGISLLGVCL